MKKLYFLFSLLSVSLSAQPSFSGDFDKEALFEKRAELRQERLRTLKLEQTFWNTCPGRCLEPNSKCQEFNLLQQFFNQAGVEACEQSKHDYLHGVHRVNLLKDEIFALRKKVINKGLDPDVCD